MIGRMPRPRLPDDERRAHRIEVLVNDDELENATTVGYGDVYPVTIGGRIFTAVILLVGLAPGLRGGPSPAWLQRPALRRGRHSRCERQDIRGRGILREVSSALRAAYMIAYSGRLS